MSILSRAAPRQHPPCGPWWRYGRRVEIDALVTDLDGTFWATDMAVHPATLDAVAQLDAAGVPLLVATGRRAQGTLAGLVPAGLGDRPAIMMNGALARDRVDGPSFLTEAMATDDVESVIAAFAEVGLEPLAYVDHPNEDLVAGPNASAGADYLGRARGVRHVADLLDTLRSEPVIGFGAFGFSKDLLQPLADQINEAGWANALLGESLIEGGWGIMLQASGIDKQTGIEAWCAREGIDPTRLAVVGDGGNDVLMLEHARIAIVPTNAPDEIRALASVEIAPNEEGGWKDIPGILGL